MSVVQLLRKQILNEDPPVLAPGHTPATVGDKISSVVFGRMPLWFYAGMLVALSI